MSEEPHQEQRPKMTFLELVAVAIGCMLAGGVLLSLCLPAFSRFSERGNITKSISNCRQIVMALKLYASDHDGKYPDAFLKAPKSSNEVFRELFKEEIIDDEAIFGSPVSLFFPDGNIGSDEEKSKALEPGENHWAMTAGLSDRMDGNIPLIFENPVAATWPPKWNANAVEKMEKGRVWKTGVVLGMNDGGAQITPLTSKKGTEVGLKPESTTGKGLFESAIDPVVFPVGHVLDMEEKQK